MKQLLFWLAALSLAHGALAQDAEDPAAARSRISTERAQVEAGFRVQEKACYGKFAVNDCLKDARARRREAMADLKRQETSLNDADRKRKGAERQRAIEERATAEKNAAAPDRPAKGKAAHPLPQADAPPKSADRAHAAEANAADARERKRLAQLKTEEKKAEALRRAEDAAQNAQRSKDQQTEAKEHKASVEKRLAERKKPPARPLPPP